MDERGQNGSKARLAGFFDFTLALVIVAALLMLAATPRVSQALAAGAYGALLIPAGVYLLVFFTLSMVWVNHHQLLGAAEAVSKRGLWLTLHVLFWISLFPAAVGPFAAGGALRLVPYAVVLTGMALALLLLRLQSKTAETGNSAMGALHRSSTYRSLAATLICAGSIPLAFEIPEAAMVCFVLAPALFLFPEPEAR